MPARLRDSPCRVAIAQLLRQTSHIIAVRERHMNRCIAPNTGVENRAGGTSGLNNNNSQQRPTPPNPRPRTTWLQDKSRPLALISRTHRSNITTGKRQHRNSNTHGASSSSSSSSPGAAAEAAPPPFPAASRLRLPPGLVGASPAAPASSFFLSSACVACFPTLRQSQNAATGRTLCRVVDGVGSKKKRTWGRITDVAGCPSRQEQREARRENRTRVVHGAYTRTVPSHCGVVTTEPCTAASHLADETKY